jgi:hypothetical protein
MTLRGDTTLCTRHAHSKYIIDNRMFTIQFKNGRWSENISLQKLNVNPYSCLNLFSIWDILNFMIAILVYKYCQQYLYKKKCTSIVIFPPKKLNSMIMIFFLFCYGVLMKLCFYSLVIAQYTNMSLQYTSTTFIIIIKDH